MKFLVDAQLPAGLARFLNDTGCDALHTSELPDAGIGVLHAHGPRNILTVSAKSHRCRQLSPVRSAASRMTKSRLRRARW